MGTRSSAARGLARWAAFAKDEHGATAIEYALIAGGVALAVISSVFTLGNTVRDDLYAPIQNNFPGN